jgi:transcriptional regulator with XRE-family HTH domain
MLLKRREACGIFHGRKVYSRRSAATARRDFRNVTVTNVELLKLGLRIRASRKVLGWTQKRFSRKCGLGRSYFGGVERGKRNMTFSVLCQICDSLSCDIATVTKGIPHLQTVGGPNPPFEGRLRSERIRQTAGFKPHSVKEADGAASVLAFGLGWRQSLSLCGGYPPKM